MTTEQHNERAAEILKVIGHPVRLRIIAALAERENRVMTLVEALEVKQSIISQQLRILRLEGLVESVCVDGVSRYQLVVHQLAQLMPLLYAIVGDQLGGTMPKTIGSGERKGTGTR
ncbi:ArsR/SmtB family transcription factor [Myxococcota bacterium]